MITPQKVVFDCVVFAQALLSTKGPAAECIKRAREARVQLIISAEILQEIRELHLKLPPGYGVQPEHTDKLAVEMQSIAGVVENIPHVFTHPSDPDDSIYINLALASESRLIISWDRHLLNLMDLKRPEGRDFRKLFPQLIVLPPDLFVRQLRAEDFENSGR